MMRGMRLLSDEQVGLAINEYIQFRLVANEQEPPIRTYASTIVCIDTQHNNDGQSALYRCRTSNKRRKFPNELGIKRRGAASVVNPVCSSI